MDRRWRKLVKDLYAAKRPKSDDSTVTAAYDCIKYDIMHNGSLPLPSLTPLYAHVKRLADFVNPAEYGISEEERLHIGHSICEDLLWKILADLETR